MKPRKEKAIEAIQGTAWCPKKKGGMRFQIEALQEKCPRCTVRKKYRCDTPKVMKALKKAREEVRVEEGDRP